MESYCRGSGRKTAKALKYKLTGWFKGVSGGPILDNKCRAYGVHIRLYNNQGVAVTGTMQDVLRELAEQAEVELKPTENSECSIER